MDALPLLRLRLEEKCAASCPACRRYHLSPFAFAPPYHYCSLDTSSDHKHYFCLSFLHAFQSNATIASSLSSNQNPCCLSFIHTRLLSKINQQLPNTTQLNHSAEPNCEITFDNQGNCAVQSLYDIPPNTPLTISLGDPTNPTPIFAQYGFLPNDCATIFCKAIHLDRQIKDLGYDFKDLLIQTQTGEIAPKVWDIFLYEMLQNNDPNSADAFYVACKTNDESTKQQYHDHYFQYTLDAIKNHVYSILGDVDQLSMQAQSYDLETHPRVPVIVAHNNLVRDTFTMTASLLEQMG